MSSDNILDLIILGGGCAGLSLAREVAHYAPNVKVALVEQRPSYSDDRTWCFWDELGHSLQHLVTHWWTAWHIGAENRPGVTHHCLTQPYQMIRGIDFYRDALQVIAGASNVEICLGTRVNRLSSTPAHVEVFTSRGTMQARHVVETRPPALGQQQKATFRQCFIGSEIVTERPVFQPHCVNLMSAMTVDDLGFRFRYVLPLTARQALIETTRFTAQPCPPDILRRDLASDIGAITRRHQWRMIRRETGCLPMGLPAAEKPPSRVVVAGTAGGALRASSGYGFRRIQTWAHDCAKQLAVTGMPTAQPADGPILRFADRTLLRALAEAPERSCEYFDNLARALDGDAFARFMNGKGTVSDWCRTVRALPKTPFLRAAGRGLWEHRAAPA